MPMKVATVDILIEKAHFEPRVAVAVAEAMDEAIDGKMHESQLVTVAILDSRLADLKSELVGDMHSLRGEMHSMKSELRSEMHAMKSELRGEMHAMKGDILRHMYTAMLGQLALLLSVAYFFVLHVK